MSKVTTEDIDEVLVKFGISKPERIQISRLVVGMISTVKVLNEPTEQEVEEASIEFTKQNSIGHESSRSEIMSEQAFMAGAAWYKVKIGR